MKKLLLTFLPLIAISGCNSKPDTGWTANCEKYHSLDSREYAQCKTRLEKQKPNEAPGQVVLDPVGTELPQEQDIGKGHNH